MVEQRALILKTLREYVALGEELGDGVVSASEFAARCEGQMISQGVVKCNAMPIRTKIISIANIV